MESNKEKTRQVLAIMDRNNSNSSLTVESAARINNDEVCGPTAANNELETESAAARMNPVIGFGPQTIQSLLAIKGYSNIKENVDFSTIFDYVSDDDFFTNVMSDRYFFMWVTARDDKVCKKYCRPLDGVIRTLKELNVIPLPDQLTHPFCRCRIIKVRI